MNFFGHAAVAAWRSTDPSFVLGSMLPDFATMIRARQPQVGHATLADGVAYHHRTDDAFHDSGVFRELMREAHDQLSTAGLRRGSARAVAHVGVEILLDGVLADAPSARHAYLSALARAPLLASELEWRTDADAAAFRGLLRALAGRGLSREHTAPTVVALRVERTLSDRPRLAIDPSQLELVAHWASTMMDAVRTETPRLVSELESALLSSSGLAR